MQALSFLHDDIKRSHELSENEQALQNDLNSFLSGYQEKKKILDRLMHGESIFHHLGKLEILLDKEIEEIESSEGEEHEILRDLKYLSHDTYLQQVSSLKTQINDAREKDKYLLHLLREVNDLLKAQAHKIRKLKCTGNDLALEHELINLLTIERGLVEKIADTDSLQHLFKEIYQAELAEYRLKKSEKRLARQITKRMSDICVNEEGKVAAQSEHYLTKLTANIMNLLKQEIMEAVITNKIDKHPYTDVEYVNSELFETFVRKEISADKSVGKIVPSDRTIRLFIQIFREVYYREEVPSQR